MRHFTLSLQVLTICSITISIAFCGCKQQNKKGDITLEVNGTSFVMKYVEGGTFWMGVQNENPQGMNYVKDAWENNTVHRVTVNSYYIGETEVTQGLWHSIMGTYPSYYNGDNNSELFASLTRLSDPHYSDDIGEYNRDSLPVENISWNEIVEKFLPKLNQLTNRTFRLPTEAEWEFAARGGNYSKGYKYSGSDSLRSVAWADYMFGGTRPVKRKFPNELGIYDMSGNVCEWCLDYDSNYDFNDSINPVGPKTGFSHIIRGGYWGSVGGWKCEVYYRDSDSNWRYDWEIMKKKDRDKDTGFRIVLIDN